MKRLITFLSVLALSTACLCSCNKDEGGTFPTGSVWSGNGGTATFTATILSFTSSTGETTSAPYSITANAEGIAVYFNTSLPIGSKTFVTGAAYEGNQMMVLYDSGPTQCLNFTLKSK